MIPIARPLSGAEKREAVFQVRSSGRLAQGEYVSALKRSFGAVCPENKALNITSGLGTDNTMGGGRVTAYSPQLMSLVGQREILWPSGGNSGGEQCQLRLSL